MPKVSNAINTCNLVWSHKAILPPSSVLTVYPSLVSAFGVWAWTKSTPGWLPLTTVLVLWLVCRLPRQQQQRVGSTAGGGACQRKAPPGGPDSAPRALKSEGIGGRKENKGKKKRKPIRKSSISLLQRTALDGLDFDSPSMPTDSHMRRNVPLQTRWPPPLCGIVGNVVW